MWVDADIGLKMSFKNYGCICCSGPQRAKPIRAICSTRDLTFTAHGNEILVWKRLEEVSIYIITCFFFLGSSFSRWFVVLLQVGNFVAHRADITQLMLFGHYIISLDIDQRMFVWEAGTRMYCFCRCWNCISHTPTHNSNITVKIFNEINFREMGENRTITCLVHPPTYLNKIVVCFDNGSMELWNLRSKQKIYEFSSKKLGTNGNDDLNLLDKRHVSHLVSRSHLAQSSFHRRQN